MTRDRVRFGIVGAGRAAQLYAQAFQSCPRAVVVAVADVRLEAAQALAEGLGCASHAGHEALPGRDGIDAVVVCTPPATHPALCRHFLQRGVHVLCEKPFALDSQSAATMVDAAAAAGVHLAMATKFRYVDDVVRAKSVLLSGAVGEPVLLENAFTSRVDMSGRWNALPPVSGGGVLIDNGTHSVDLMRYFLGPVQAVLATEARRIQPLPVEDTVHMFIRSASGVLGSIDLSWSIAKEDDSYLRIFGTHGSIVVGWARSCYRQSSSHDWVVFGRGYDKIDAFARQIDNFCGVIRGDEPLLTTPDDALASVAVIEAAYEALRAACWVPVAAGPTPSPSRS